MNNFQEIQRLEASLSPSHAAAVKAQCTTQAEYLHRLRAEKRASDAAIARLTSR